MSAVNGRPKRILLGHLASNGDCLYATTVARQIKVDYPGCHLTWAIGSAYQSVIKLNPDVDETWVIENYTDPSDRPAWDRFIAEATERKAKGEFDEIFLTQIAPANMRNWVGSVRDSVYRNYPHPITVDKTPVLRLAPEEVENVRQFAAEHRLTEKKHIVLFECSPRSEQSYMNLEIAIEIAQKIVATRDDVAFVLSSYKAFESPHPSIISGKVLSLRENAELSKYCTLLIGASSGISWITTSDWAKPLPMLQLLRPDLVRSNSLMYDFEKRGVGTSNLMEMSSYTIEDVCQCVSTILDQGFAAAKSKFHQKTPLKFQLYKDLMRYFLFHGEYKNAWRVFTLNVKEYGLKAPIILIPIYVPLRWLAMRPVHLFRKLARRGP